MESIRVMISSRVGGPLGGGGNGPRVGDAARAVQEQLKDVELFPGAKFPQKPLFDFDLSLDDGSRPADSNIERACREMVAKSDIVLALYNGQAGSSLAPGADGICFLEMRTAKDYAPEKLVVVRLPAQGSGAADKRFEDWFAAQQIWAAPKPAGSVEAVVDASCHALRVAVARMVQRAGRVRAGNFHLGAALEWSRMNYRDRAAAMRQAVCDAMPPGAEELQSSASDRVLMTIGKGKERVLICIHAVPAALSEPRAREMVGQPYLEDYLFEKELRNAAGPLHVVACARGVTEAQAVRILGFPDATIVKAPFGIFVADEVQKIQMAFIAQCRDQGSTRDAVSEFLLWLDQTGERDTILARGKLRAELVKLLAKSVP